MTDMIVPFYTKFIVVDKITPVYKQTLNTLQSRAFEAERTPNKTNLLGMLNIQTVSMEWLRQCFIQEKLLPSELYKPQVSEVNGTSHTQPSLTQNSQRASYRVKLNILQGKTFSIHRESFQSQ